MKNLRKIIALFLLIFVTGIFITVVSVNKTLDKKSPSTTVEITKDSLYLLKAEKEAV
jgi:hypothetical protein